MMITHTIDIDLTDPTTVPRIQVKQSDSLSHRIQIQLYDDGEAWDIPTDVAPLIRYHIHDLDGAEDSQGIYDTLPDGSDPFQFTRNVMYVLPTPQMFARHSIVTVDLVLVQDSSILATANFEFYVNRAPSDGTEAEAQSYYRVATLEQINADLEDIHAQLDTLAEMLSNL